jgi:hypothetical protein
MRWFRTYNWYSLIETPNAMPYFVFRIQPGPGRIVSALQFQNECESFKEAKELARSLRAALPKDDSGTIRLIFANDRLEAEELITTPREQPILLEWEK